MLGSISQHSNRDTARVRDNGLNKVTDLRTEFIEAMSHAAFTVSLVTTDGLAGPAGLTASAMTSVSADPPSILVCVNRGSQFAACVQRNRQFGVSILRSDQTELADTFAGRRNLEDRFSIGHWVNSEQRVPLLSDAIVALDCGLLDCKPVGTHDIVVGLVRNVAFGQSSKLPMIHHRRRYGVPSVTEEATNPA